MYADRRIDWREVKELLLASYRQVALKRMLASLEAQRDDRRESKPSR
jgi:hypothetical protein